jgi:hypothetical protein
VSHASGTIIINSLLEIFDPADAEYEGVRDHFTAQELAKIDEIRALPATHEFSFLEKVFVSYVLDKAIFTGS